MRWNFVPKDKLQKLSEIALKHNLKAENIGDELVIQLLQQLDLFDVEFYETTYPDVKNADIDPLMHYIKIGWREGRNPNIWFDTNLYVRENPEIIVNPFLHFIIHGFNEERRPNSQERKKRGRLIVSLEATASEYDTIAATIESLLCQSMPADKIIIQMSKNSLLDQQYVYNFIELIDRGLDIHWHDEPEGYGAVIPALINYPDDIIITCGCERSLEPDFLEKLWEAYIRKPSDVHCFFASRLNLEKGNTPLPPGEHENDPAASFLIIPHARHGMLLPPRVWSPIATERAIYSRHAPRCPDLWYWMMSVYSGIAINTVPDESGKSRTIEIIHDISKLEKNQKQELISLLYFFKDEIMHKLNISIYDACLKNEVKDAYYNKYRKNLDFANISSFTEKIQYLKVYDDLPIKSLLSDKYLIRKYIRDKIGEEFLIPLLGIWPTFEQINFDILPKQFVLKTNHASGSNQIIRSKFSINKNQLQIKFNKWMSKNYALNCWEMNYFNIKPLIMAEYFLGDNISDYKFVCSLGRILFIYVDVNKNSDYRRNIYSEDWILQEWNLRFRNSDIDIPRPERLDEMIDIARFLSRQFKLVSIDFYYYNNNIKIGEMTFYPGAGYNTFYPLEADYLVGKHIQIY
ncbi:MAG: hypothetical protein HDQ91_04585 [Desulfovibrio sp.]|nr:hypothetical protein [Desulfovibrio sp.]